MNKKAILELIRTKCCCGGSNANAGCCYEEITLAQAQELVASEQVVPNKLYKITGVHKNKMNTIEQQVDIPVLYDDGTDSGVNIYLTGITETKFSKEGWGEFWNPNYRQDLYNDVDPTPIFITISFVGSGYANASNVAVTGGTGTGLIVDIVTNAGEVTAITVVSPGTGYTNGDLLNIPGGNSDATLNYAIGNGVGLYNIWDGDSEQVNSRPNAYVVGSKKIWGGYVWTSITGALGTALDVLTLDGTNWEKVPYNSTDYTLVLDYIEYDYGHDWISRRRNIENEVDVIFPYSRWNGIGSPGVSFTFHAIAVAQWGNYTMGINQETQFYGGVSGITVKDSIFEFVNFKGIYMAGIDVLNHSYIIDNYYGYNTQFEKIKIENYSYQKNCKFYSGAYQKSIIITNWSAQDNIKIGVHTDENTVAYQELLILSNNSSQANIILDWGSYQYYVELRNGSWQYNLNFNAEEELDEPTRCYQYNVILDSYSSQFQISFVSGSSQHGLTLSNESFQQYLNFDNSVQEWCSFTNFAFQQNGPNSTNTIINSYQANIAFINGAYQENFGMLDFRQEFCSFNTQGTDYTDAVLAQPTNFPEKGTKSDFNSITYDLLINFDGSPGKGSTGNIDIPDLYIMPGFFISEVVVYTDSLVFNPGAYVSLGIDLDDADSGLNSTTGDCATLAATPVFVLNSLPFTLSTGNNRKLALAANVDSISGGTMKVIVTTKRV